MRALLYDIHGNLPALEAVLADAQSAGVDEFAFGGDYALAGAFPEECVKRIEGLTGEFDPGQHRPLAGGPVRHARRRSAAPPDRVLPG